jgi:hypothetical protein
MATRRKPSPDSGGGDDQYLGARSAPGRWGDPSRYDPARAPLAVGAIVACIVGVGVAVHAAGGLEPDAARMRPGLGSHPTASERGSGESAFRATPDQTPRPTGDTQTRTRPDRTDYQGAPMSDDSPVEDVESTRPVNCLSTGDKVCGPDWKKPRADVLGVLEAHGYCVWLPATKTNKLRHTWIACEDGYMQVADD